jgi:DNA-binding protein
MKIRFLGPAPEVQIAATGQSVKRGETVDVEAIVARELVKQSSWKKIVTKKKEP